MNAGIGEGRTDADLRSWANQLYALYAAGREARLMAGVVGHSGLSDADRRALTFADRLEEVLLTQPERRTFGELQTRMVWGISIPSLGELPPVARTLAVRDQAQATPGPAAEQAASSFERLIELLLQAAPQELLLQHLGKQLLRTTRQVNRLELRLEPALLAQHSAIERTLEEREREDHVRLRRMMRRRTADR